MLTTLLLPLLVSVPAPTDSVPVQAGDPAIRVWLSKSARYERGDRAKVEVRAARDGHLVVLHADPAGRIRVLFPLDPRNDDFVRGGKTYEVRSRGDRDAFYVDESEGTGTVYAAISLDPFVYDAYVRGDHWDYRELGHVSASDDVEAVLTDVVRRMMPVGRFEYDVVRYEVEDPPARGYASYYGYPYWDPFYTSCFSCGRVYHTGGFGVRITFGYPGRHYYDPWYYDPWYYDPWYYGGYHYRPVYTYPVYYGGWSRHYPHRYRYVDSRPYAWDRGDYRFKGNTFGQPADEYRDRRSTFSGRGVAPEPRAVSAGERRRTLDPAAGERRRVERDRTPSPPAEGRKVEPRRAEPRSAEPRRAEPRKSEPRRVEPRGGEESRRAEPRRAEPSGEAAPRRVEPRRSEVRSAESARKAEPRRVEPRGDDDRRAEPRRVEPRGDGDRRAEPRRVEPRGDDDRRAEPRRVEPRGDGDRRAEPRRVEPPRAEPRRAEPRRADPPRAQPRSPEPRRVEPRRSEPRRAERPKATPRRAEPRSGRGGRSGASGARSNGGGRRGG